MIKTVLAGSEHVGGINAILPVINFLNVQKNIEVIIMGNSDSLKVLRAQDLPYVTPKKYSHNGESSILLMEHVIQIENPNLILTGTATQDTNLEIALDQALTVAGKEKKVPTLAVLDAHLNYVERFSDIHFHQDFAFMPNKIAIMDEIAKKEMLKLKFNARNLAVTGNPYLDNLGKIKSNFTDEDILNVRNDFGFVTTQPMITYISDFLTKYYGVEGSGYPDLGYNEKTVFRDILEAVTEIEKPIQVLAKLHRAQPKDALLDIVDDFKADVNIKVGFQEYDAKLAVLASDLTLGCFTSVLNEVALFDKLGISIIPGLGKDKLITNKLGVNPVVSDKKYLASAISNGLFNTAYQDTWRAARRNFRSDGKATQNVVELVYSMMR
jgi:hypothetical protein